MEWEDEEPNYRRVVALQAFDYGFNDLIVEAYGEEESPNKLKGTKPIVHFHYLSIKGQASVSFGDVLAWDTLTGDWFIIRGPNLRFKLQLGKSIPSSMLTKLVQDRTSDNPPFQPRVI